MGHRSIPFQFGGLWWLGSNAYTLESWDRWSCTSWEKEGPGSWPSANVWNMSKIPKFTCHPIIPVWLGMQPLYLPTWTQLSFSPEERESVHRVGEIVIQVSKFYDPFCVWNVLPVVTFSKRNFWSGSHNSKALVSDLPLESHLISVYEKMCVLCIYLLTELQNVAKFCNTPCKTLSFLSKKWTNIFWQASICLWITHYVDSHSEATSLTQVMKPESCPVMAATLSVHYTNTKWPIQFSLYVIIQRLK